MKSITYRKRKLGRKRVGLFTFNEVFSLLNSVSIKIWIGKACMCCIYLGKISDKNKIVIENLKEKLDAELKPKGLKI